MESPLIADLWGVHVPVAVSLAVLAALGYLVSRRVMANSKGSAVSAGRELRKARSVVREMERIARLLRKGLARHHASLSKFKQRLAQLSSQREDVAWKGLCQEAKEMLPPTLRLATQIAGAYDMVRQQANRLTMFSEVRIDPLTGVTNRRGMDEGLASQFAMRNRYGLELSVLIVDVDHFKRINDEQGHLEGDRLLQRVARLLDESAREVDLVARSGGGEFVIVMPRTDLEGAAVLAERIRAEVRQQLHITISGGITTALDGDTPELLLARADAALYEAKAAGRDRVFRHDGTQVEPILEEAVMVASR